jgi:hypothetical protein
VIPSPIWWLFDRSGVEAADTVESVSTTVDTPIASERQACEDPEAAREVWKETVEET